MAAEAVEEPLELPLVVVAAAVLEAALLEEDEAEVEAAAAELVEDSPEEALAEPQVTLWQAVMPVKSLGCAFTQSAFHCAQTNDGTVWS